MPDSDRIPRVPRRHWRRPCVAMIGDQEPAHVGHEIDVALAATLRDHPLAPPRQLAAAMCEAARTNDDALFRNALAGYTRDAGIDPLTSQVGAQAVAMMEIGPGTLIDRSEQEVVSDLVIGALRGFAEASLCGADDVNKAMLENGATLAQVHERQRSCLDAAQLEVSAAQILAESGAPARAPRIRIEKLSTAELLKQPL